LTKQLEKLRRKMESFEAERRRIKRELAIIKQKIDQLEEELRIFYN